MGFTDINLISKIAKNRYEEFNTHELLKNDWFGVVRYIENDNFIFEIDIYHSDNYNADKETINSFLQQYKRTLLNSEAFSGVHTYNSCKFVYYRLNNKLFSVYAFINHDPDPLSLKWLGYLLKTSYAYSSSTSELTHQKEYLFYLLDQIHSIVFIVSNKGKILLSNKNSGRLFKNNCCTNIDNLCFDNSEKLRLLINDSLISGKDFFYPKFSAKFNGEFLIYDIRITPLKDANNIVYAVLCVINDITNSAISEFTTLQNNQYNIMGEIAAGLAHDIRNPLSNIRNGLAALSKYDIPANKSPIPRILLSETDRINEVVSEIMSFSSDAINNSGNEININEIIRNCINVVSRQGSISNVKISSRLSPQILSIHGKSYEIQQIITNLLINAMQSIKNGGEVSVSSVLSKNKHDIIIHVKDNGTGISKENMKNLFEPYFTTKEDGIGMGLYTVKNVIAKYQGSINIKSVYGKGTDVVIRLPYRRFQHYGVEQ